MWAVQTNDSGVKSGCDGRRRSLLSPCPLSPTSSETPAGTSTLPLRRSEMTVESVLKAEKSPALINVLEAASHQQAGPWEGQFSTMFKNEMPLGLNLDLTSCKSDALGKSLLRSESYCLCL